VSSAVALDGLRPGSAPQQVPRWLLVVTLALVALNLREVLTSVPPLTVDIAGQMGWNAVTIGALTTLPVLGMCMFALIVPRLAATLGTRRTVWIGLGILVMSLGLRILGAVPGVLHLAVLLAGLGLAMVGGLMPTIVREQFPERVGLTSGMWTAGMFVGATLGAGLTVPLELALGSWQAALAFWTIPAAAALLVWTIVQRPWASGQGSGAVSLRLPLRSPPAWALTAYCAVNSLIFYAAVAWLAPSYEERGWTQAGSGLLFAIFAFAQVFGALLFPPLAQRLHDARGILIATTGITVIAFALIATSLPVPPALTLALLGFSHSGGFALCISLISVYAANGNAATRLTAMVYSVMFLFAALGPLVTGAILQSTGSWTTLFGFLAVFSLVQLAPLPWLRHGSSIS
jgi:CP family cyanate transporter-like MFS transporter